MRRLAILLLLLWPAAAQAHTAAASEPGWPGPEPWMLMPMLATAGLYAAGLIALAPRSGVGSPVHDLTKPFASSRSSVRYKAPMETLRFVRVSMSCRTGTP